MLRIMGAHLSRGDEFYNVVISFILTIAFLSPTKGLLTLNIFDKLYLLGGMLITFILFSFKFVENAAGTISKEAAKKLMNLKNKK